MKLQPQMLVTRLLSPVQLQKIEAANLEVDTISFIKVTPRKSDRLQIRIRQIATEEQEVIFTSAHAVHAVFSQVMPPPNWKIYCISGATAQAVTQYLPLSAIVATAGYGKDLAEQFLTHSKSVTAPVFFCGKRRLPAIPNRLGQQGRPIEEIVVYDTTLMPRRVQKEYAGIAFFSPSGVESFFSQNALPQSTVLFSIGHTTTQAIRKYTARAVHTCDPPGTNNLIELIIHYFQRNHTNHDNPK